jgi:hypothetical protein
MVKFKATVLICKIMADKKIFFTDTNLFLQCKPLKDLDWSKISNGDDILLIISRPVQKEIDRLKYDGNDRRAKRARVATSFMREILASKETILAIKDVNPRVEVSFSESISSKNPRPDILDLSRNDDQIIAEALLYKEGNLGANIALLTDDTHAKLTAKRCDLPFIDIPDDWSLPPEPDSRDKRISELEKEIKKYKESSPIIEITAKGENGSEIKTIEFAITQYDDLSDDEIETLANIVFENYPLKTNFDRGSQIEPLRLGPAEAQFVKWEYNPPMEEEIEQYQTVSYSAWQGKVMDFFKRLAYKKEYPGRNVNIGITIENTGGEPAENLIVEFEVFGGILFQIPGDNSERKETIEEIILPAPPKPPEGDWFKKLIRPSMLDTFKYLQPSIPEIKPKLNYETVLSIPQPVYIPTPRDKNKFYWKDGRPYERTDKWAFECDEFRHKFEPKGFEITLFVPRKNGLEKGAVKCKVTANNLREPVEKIIPVKIKYAHGDINKIANDYIDSIKVPKFLMRNKN